MLCLLTLSINQSLLRQKAAHAETHNKAKHKLQTKLTAMKQKRPEGPLNINVMHTRLERIDVSVG